MRKENTLLTCPSLVEALPHLVRDVNHSTKRGSEDESIAAIAEHLRSCTECGVYRRLVANLEDFGLAPSDTLTTPNDILWEAFMDESGTNTPTYSNVRFPSLTLAAVLTLREKIPAIEGVREGILSKFGLPEDTEIHSSECLHGQGPFHNLSLTSREELLATFIEESHPHYLFSYSPDMLKSMVSKSTQEQLADGGHSQYSILFAYILLVIGKFVELVLLGRLSVYVDRNDAVIEDLRRVAGRLRVHRNSKMRLQRLCGEPEPVESRRSAVIQLADVIAHYACRYHRIEVPKFGHGNGLEKHRTKVEHVYDSLIKPKDLPWFMPEIWMHIDLKSLSAMGIID